MVLRVPYDTAESLFGSPSPFASRSSHHIDVDLDRLAVAIRDANGPVAIQELAREAVRAMIVADGSLRTYVPGSLYEQGERVRLLDGRLGDVTFLESGENTVQGAFTIIVVRMPDGETVRLASGVNGAPQAATPELVSDETVEMLLLGQEQEMVRRVRQAMAADPRFITLYHGDTEYGCLREFFPPMSPDVLDAALALLLDELFDQVPVARVTEAPIETVAAKGAIGTPAEPLFSTTLLDGALAADFRSGSRARQPTLGAGAADTLQEPIGEIFETVRALWVRAETSGTDWGAAQLARVFLQPVLRALGWSSVPVPTRDFETRGPHGERHCYALCADHFSASELYLRSDDGQDMQAWALALMQVAPWGDALDPPKRDHGTQASLARDPEMLGDGLVRPDSGSADGGMSPAHQLVGDLHETEVPWGILTNGRVWRLISQDANSLARTYYEVDLGDVFDNLALGKPLGRERWEVFRRWWLLFRQASYVRGRDGRCLLAHLREREPRVERQMRALLRERLLTKALPAIAGGFVAYRHRRLGLRREPPSSLNDIYEASVWLLTRLLFVLAAEARGWLPQSAPAYRPHSLTTQAIWAAERIHRDLPLSDGVYTTARYDVVLSLFQRIAKGDAEKALPTYGRLFFDPTSCEAHRFFERTRLSDRALGQALEAIFSGIDYEIFDARDLIGVCSALLGGQLAVIDADAGDVLITHQGDDRVRSETLPDFVVTSVVEQAITPLLSARAQVFEAAMDDVVDVRQRLQRALDRQQRSALYAEWESASRRARDAFLSIRVCDPAMGAGDFLLSSVDVWTDGIIASLHAYHRAHPHVPREWNPIYRLLDEVSEDVGAELARQGVTDLTPQAAAPSDTVVLSRLVAQRTLFGVADDTQAVEIAKAGLWLHTFAVGAPLSFLDHHLMSGNALLGADLFEVADRYQLSDGLDALLEEVGTLYALTERVDTTPLDVRWSATQFDRVDQALTPYRRMLDLAMSAALGTAEAEGILESLEPATWQSLMAETVPAWVAAQAEAEGFFHWALAFPEVFVDLTEGTWRDRPGFDLVIGAPPWCATSEEALAAYYEARFQRPGEDYNPHHAFLGLAHDLIRRPGGRTAYVLSREWLAGPTGGI